MHRSRSFSAAVQGSYHTTSPFAESYASIGFTHNLKCGIRGAAYISFPTTPYNSFKFVGIAIYYRFPKKFSPNANPSYVNSKPKMLALSVKNLHLRRFIINPIPTSIFNTFMVLFQHNLHYTL